MIFFNVLIQNIFVDTGLNVRRELFVMRTETLGRVCREREREQSPIGSDRHERSFFMSVRSRHLLIGYRARVMDIGQLFILSAYLDLAVEVG